MLLVTSLCQEPVDFSIVTEDDDLPWLTRHIRLSTFPAVVVQETESWWQKVIGSEAESVIRQRPRGFLRQEANFHAGKLYLVSLPDRIDWIWQAIDKVDSEEEDLATLGPHQGTMETFSNLLESWSPISPPATRLALGVELDSARRNRGQGA